jgi:hypothetical protein
MHADVRANAVSKSREPLDIECNPSLITAKAKKRFRWAGGGAAKEIIQLMYILGKSKWYWWNCLQATELLGCIFSHCQSRFMYEYKEAYESLQDLRADATHLKGLYGPYLDNTPVKV